MLGGVELKILFAHDHYFFMDEEKVYSESGFSYEMWRRYILKSNEVLVIGRGGILNNTQNLDEMNVSSGLHVNFLIIPNLSKPFIRFKEYSKTVEKVTEALNNTDCLIARLPSEIGSFAIKLAKKLGKPWAVEVVGHVWDSYWNYGDWKGKLYAPYATWKTKKLISQSSHAIYVTRNYLQDIYPCYGKTAECSNVEIPIIDQSILQSRFKKIETTKSPMKIGLIGSLYASYKGVDTALQALKILKGQIPVFEFHILGGGNPQPWRDMAEKLGLEKQIFFSGTLPGGEAVHNWLSDIDLYIQPSLTEGLPRALIEAMSTGCPAIASTAGGIPELLDPSCLHRPKDFNKLAELIKKGILDVNWRKNQARRNYETAKQYSKLALDLKRDRFWNEFFEYVRYGV